MKIEIKGMDKVISRLDRLGLRVRFAAQKTVNEVAATTRALLVQEAKDSFEGGITKYVERGIRYRTGQVEEGGITARVFLSDVQGPKGQLSVTEILRPHIKGGGRARKNSERRTRPWYLVPSKYVPLDAQGNVPAAYMQQILSAAGLYKGSSAQMNQTDQSRARRGTGRRKGAALERGVYVVPGVGIFQYQQQFHAGTGKTHYNGPSIPLFFFVNRPQYEAGRFDFYGVSKRHIRRALPSVLKKHLRVELKR